MASPSIKISRRRSIVRAEAQGMRRDERGIRRYSALPEFGRPLMALFGHGEMSDLIPLCAVKRTSSPPSLGKAGVARMSAAISGIFASTAPASRGARHRAALCADPLAHAGYMLLAWCELLRLARKRNLAPWPRQINTTGKSPKPTSSPFAKNILIFRRRKSVYIPPVPPDERGGSRSSRTCGGMRWTRWRQMTNAAVADSEAVWS